MNPTMGDPDALMRKWDEEIQAKLKQADQISQAAREVRVTQRSKDGSVSVTVDSGGNVTALDLTDAALRKQPAQLSAEILGIMRSAQAQIATRMQEAMAPVLGDDSATMNAVMGGFQEKFPQPPQETEQPPKAPQPPNDDDFQGHNWAREQKGW